MRYFEKRGGPTVAFWQIEQEGVRYLVAWGTVGSRGQGGTYTRDSEADCARMVERKIREKLAAGFVEVPRAPAAVAPARELESVLGAYAAHAAKFAFGTVKKLPGLERSYHVLGGLGFEEYVLLGPTETTGLWFVVKAASWDEELVRRFLRQLEARHAEVFAVEVAWKLRLDEPVGALDHALILAPVVARVAMKGLASTQLFQGLPIYDCEFRGDESIAEAEARTKGRGCIPTSTWNRAPHPVLDMRVQSSATKAKSKLLIYPPDQIAPFVRRVASLSPGSFLEVRSYRGELCRVTRGEALEVVSGKDGTPRRLSIEEVVAHLEAFVRGSK